MMTKRGLYCTLATLLGLVLATLLLWFYTTRPALADPNVRHVAEIGTDGSNDCKKPGSPCRTIQHAVDVAEPDDAVHVAGGTYTSTAGPVAVITKPLAIVGGFDPSFTGPNPEMYRTVLDAGWKSSAISITNAGNVVLDFLSLTHGDGTGNCSGSGCGGGIYVANTELHVGHCIVTDNVGSRAYQGWGGGIYSFYSNISVHGTQIVSNVANADLSSTTNGSGGGLYILGGTASLVENQVISNVGHVSLTGHGHCGGILLADMTHVEVLDSVIANNRAASGSISGIGGGICINVTTWSYVANNRIEGNRTGGGYAGHGGGIRFFYGKAHLTGNTIVSNTTTTGGGIYIRSSEPVTLSNNLIARNRADSLGGGIFVIPEGSHASQAILINNTIADNGNTGVTGWQYVALTLTNNIIAGHTTGVNNTIPASATVAADTNLFWNTSDPITGTNAILKDPLLTADYRLRPDSPAVDTGLTIPWLTVDLEGTARPQGGAYDIGAFEGRWWNVSLPLVLHDSQ